LTDNNGRRLIALDLDGTVLSFDEKLSDAVREQVVRLAREGRTHVVIATGRSVPTTMPVIGELGLTHGYSVCSNGSVTLSYGGAGIAGQAYPAYAIVDVITFDPGPVLRLLRAELPDASYAVEILGEPLAVNRPFPDGELSFEPTVVPFERLLERPVSRVVVRSPEHTPEDFVELTKRIGLHGVGYAVGWTAWLDLAPEGVSKASALELLRRRLGVEPNATYAVGDGRNDIEMLQWAGHSAAMGSAPPEVLATADEVLPDVTEDGLVQLLSRL
jgi:hydroxymethylpyrimidine pyrophosphatase-like HAD family hydrolase